jgi:hypothetical protein
MDNSEHTHRLSSSWRFGYLSLGAFLLLIVVGTVIFRAPGIFSDGSAFDLLGILVLIVVVFPFSLVLLARAFLIKVVVKPQGIEYHSTFFVLQADWRNLVHLGYVKRTNAGRTLVVVPRAGNLIHKKWAKPFRNILKEYPNELQDVQILVSQFGGRNGHSFETDVLANVEQSTALPEEVEVV